MTREEYLALIASGCGHFTSVYSCYGNLDPLVYRDCNTIPFGVPLVEGSVHEVFLSGVEVKLSAIKNTFKQGRTRNFRTEKEKIYQLFADPVPEWLMEDLDQVFTRGEVYIGGNGGVGGVKYLVNETSWELVDACLMLWKPSATFHTHCGMPFNCDPDPCTVESGESGPPEESETPTCCDPDISGASVDGSDEGNTITVTFVACTPTPSGGYFILYRVAGSSDGYTSVGPFMTSPAIFVDGTNPDGTQYEGFIHSDCGGGVVGDNIPWSTGLTTVQVINLSGSNVIITAVNGIPGFVLSGPVGPGSSAFGTHGAFTGSISVTLSGTPISGSLSLRKDGVLAPDASTGCINIGFAGSYSFPSVAFTTPNVIQIRWFGGAC